jgi:extracellular factor (EF) 3-hydroxypalmitic acid methyl ester biosynthesis protein
MTKTICSDFLGQSQKMLLEGRVFAGMADLVGSLRAARDASTPDDWNRFCLEDCPLHPIHDLLQQDPFTNHSFRRPRGYAGDAGLMDIIYKITPVPDSTPTLGRTIYDFCMNAPMLQSVRARRVVIAASLDAVAEKVAHPRALSVACGHGREVECCESVQNGRIEVLTAFDQDEQSLAEVKRCYVDLNIETVAGSVRGLLNGSVDLGSYDFIYSAGLYDYLLEPTARRLTRRLFEMLRPGGTLLLANFLPDLRDAGYMEAFMRWPLVYRTRQEMDALADSIPETELARRDCFYDPPGCVVFLELCRT